MPTGNCNIILSTLYTGMEILHMCFVVFSIIFYSPHIIIVYCYLPRCIFMYSIHVCMSVHNVFDNCHLQLRSMSHLLIKVDYARLHRHERKIDGNLQTIIFEWMPIKTSKNIFCQFYWRLHSQHTAYICMFYFVYLYVHITYTYVCPKTLNLHVFRITFRSMYESLSLLLPKKFRYTRPIQRSWWIYTCISVGTTIYVHTYVEAKLFFGDFWTEAIIS